MLNIRQAIVTKYHGPTDTKGSRVSATAAAGKRWFDWDDALNPEENHCGAATRFASGFSWLAQGETLQGGGLPDGRYCWVIVPAATE